MGLCSNCLHEIGEEDDECACFCHPDDVDTDPWPW